MNALRTFWLGNPNSIEAIELCAEIMEGANRHDAAAAFKRLRETLSENQDESGASVFEKHPKATFEAGYFLIDMREYELAIMLLNTCLVTNPMDGTLNYELGFALMALNRYEEAIERFQIAARIENDFDTTLNLSVCYALLRKLKEAKELMPKLKSLAKSDEERNELHHREIVLKRLESLAKKSKLSDRDWLYVLYGTVMIYDDSTISKNDNKEQSDQAKKAENKDEALPSTTRVETFRTIAATMLTLKGVLEGLRLLPEAIEFYSPQSRPLAAILARLLDLPLDSYRGPDRPDQALLVMKWASDIVGPHQVFQGNASNRMIFAYGLTRKEPLPLVPDVISHFADKLVLPWSDDTEIEEGGSSCAPEEAIAQVLERAWNMEHDPDILKAVQDAIEYYADKRPLLVMSNCANFPVRPEYSAEVPGK